MAIATTPGERLGEAIDRLGLSQIQFGQRVGVSRERIGKWVRGEAPIPQERIAEIASAVGRAEAWLRGDLDLAPGMRFDPAAGDQIAYLRGINYALSRMLYTMQNVQAEVIKAWEESIGGPVPEPPVKGPAQGEPQEPWTGREPKRRDKPGG